MNDVMRSRARVSHQGVRFLGQSGRSSSSRDRRATGATPASVRTGKNDAVNRPGASGHRFGPDLGCSECGILWDVHQRDPKPCETVAMRNAFARRPSGDFEAAPTPTKDAPAEPTKKD